GARTGAWRITDSSRTPPYASDRARPDVASNAAANGVAGRAHQIHRAPAAEFRQKSTEARSDGINRAGTFGSFPRALRRRASGNRVDTRADERLACAGPSARWQRGLRNTSGG